MRVTVKICGLTSAADAQAAAEAGADLLGFVFFPASRRCLAPSAASWLREVDRAPKVGVFRDQDRAFVEEVRRRAGLAWVQLHGGETPEECAALGGRGRVIKAVSVAGPVDWALVGAYRPVARILFDTASPTGGGTGRVFDWGLLEDRPPDLEFLLAGGLDPDNVAAAVAAVHPAGVDVASGVEREAGRKDAGKMRAFVRAARATLATGGEERP